MAKPLVSDELWERIEPLLPVCSRVSVSGPQVPARLGSVDGHPVCRETGVPWEHLPQAIGPGSGMTSWRRLQDWNEAGVWNACTRCSWMSCRTPSSSTGRELSLIARMCEPKRGTKTGPRRSTADARAPSTT